MSPSTPDRNYNIAQIMHDETHDGVGSNFPWTKVTLAGADGYGLVFAGTGVTTGKFYTITGDGLTTGSLLELTSNSSSTGTRVLVTITQDHASATGATVLKLVQDAAAPSLVIDHNGITGKALFVDAASTTQTAGVVDISVAALTTGTALDIGDGDALTTGTLVKVVSNSSDVTARNLVTITNDHASAAGAVCLDINQDGAGVAVTIDHAGTGDRQALVITTAATTVTSGVVAITGAAVTTGIGIKITLAALTTGSAIDTTGIAATKQNFNMNSSTGSTAAPQTNAPTGFFKIGIAGTDQWVPYYSAS